MLPTFRADGDIVIVLKESSYEVGDVVICESISNSQKTVCKRLAGVAGDTVEMYVPGLFSTRSLYREIPIDHVWILGDNPQNSHDSRHYGPVPITHLKGRVAYKIRLLEFPNIIQKVERVKPSLKFEI